MIRAAVLCLCLAGCRGAPPALSAHEPILCGRSAEGLSCTHFADGDRVSAPLFSDTRDWGRSPSRWATVEMVALDRDTDAVCGRGGYGVECALFTPEGFSAPVLSPVFGDHEGFDDYRYASTLQWIDADGDGLLDVCGRGAAGVVCARGAGDGSFTSPKSVDGGFFSDDHGFAAISYGGTLRFGDLDGDGRADFCVRGSDGVYCALARKSGFTSPVRWSSDFNDDQDWAGLEASRSLDLVDVDGDGRADLCGVNLAGVSCARSSGKAFTPIRVWTAVLALDGDDSRLSTPQLADVNGDGRADICGHSAGELRCFFSTGDAFESPISLGQTAGLELVDLDGDGHFDVCWPTNDGFTCTHLNGGRAHPSLSAAIGASMAIGRGIHRAARRRAEPLLNPTARENLRPATPGWWVPMPQQALHHEVEAYTAASTYLAGDSVEVFASTLREEDPVEWMVLRTGWYGGVGARKIAGGKFAGHAQPLPPTATATLPARCHWTPSISFQLPHHAVSGVYVLRLDNLRTKSSYLTTFVVRDDRRQADLIVQRSDLTDATYNNWDGGPNLSSWYFGAPLISLDRPLRSPYSFGFDMSYSAGYFTYEVSLVRFLERQGYDVKYVSDLDTDAAAPSGAKAFLVAGHDEYWSAAMRDHVEGARDAGMHLGFFGADMLDGEIVFSDARTFSVPFPGTTVKRTWAKKPIDLSRPPHDNPSDTLTGTHLGDWCGDVHPDCLVTGDGQPFARLSESDAFHLEAKHPLFRDLPLERPLLLHSVGYEYELMRDDLPFAPTVLARALGVSLGGRHPVMVAYQTPASTRVFNAGSMQLNHGLDGWAGRAAFRLKGGESPCHRRQNDCFEDESPAVQQLVVNLLADFGAQPTFLSPQLTVEKPSHWQLH